MTTIKESVQAVAGVLAVGAIVWIFVWIFGFLGDQIAESNQLKQEEFNNNKAQVLSFDAQLEAKKKCADAGLTVKEDKIQTGEYTWEVSGVNCGKPIAQVQAENLDPGMTTGEGVAAGAALGAGAYILGELIK